MLKYVPLTKKKKKIERAREKEGCFINILSSNYGLRLSQPWISLVVPLHYWCVRKRVVVDDDGLDDVSPVLIKTVK